MWDLPRPDDLRDSRIDGSGSAAAAAAMTIEGLIRVYS